MTGGGVVVLGPVGENFGAGMTGGVAYVLDERRGLERRYNPQLVRIDPVESPEEIAFLQGILERHLQLTGSPRARALLRRWPEPVANFRRVLPKSLGIPRLPVLEVFPAQPIELPSLELLV